MNTNIPAPVAAILSDEIRGITFEDARNNSWHLDAAGEELDNAVCPRPMDPPGWMWMYIGKEETARYVLVQNQGNRDGTYHTLDFYRRFIVVWTHQMNQPKAINRCDIPR